MTPRPISRTLRKIGFFPSSDKVTCADLLLVKIFFDDPFLDKMGVYTSLSGSDEDD